MKICQIYNYIAPAKDSMGAERVCESLTEGLLELGHEVTMLLDPRSKNTPAPLVQRVPQDTDIIHFHQWEPGRIDYESYGKPYVITLHSGGGPEPKSWQDATRGNPNLICVSDFISKRVGCSAFVWSCSYAYDFAIGCKDNYFLWIGGTDWGENKGIFTTIRLAKKLRFNLKIAGTGSNTGIIENIKNLCDDKIEYIGAVNGQEKSNIIAGAQATILLTQLPDACPVVISESLLSGTPVIGSINGSLPEVISDKVGCIVKNDREFAQAILKVQAGHFDSQVCREYGIENLSHLASARKYLIYYKNMIKHKNVNGV